MANPFTNNSSQFFWRWKPNSNFLFTSFDDGWRHFYDGWTDYSEVESKAIEEAFCSGRNNTQLVEFDHYWINFTDFIQINKHNENKQALIARDKNHRKNNQALLEESNLSDLKSKSFNDSGLEGGISFIYDWKKRNATLPNSEIVTRAVHGILLEGNKLGDGISAHRLVPWLLDTKDKTEAQILLHCISMYISATFLSKLLSRTLRENDKSKVDTLAPFCYFLTQAIWGDTLADRRFKGIVYRGIMLNQDMIHHYEEAIGTYKYWYGFASTSRNREVAEVFGNALCIIDISCANALDISSYLAYNYEEEVILAPGITFRIDKVEYEDTKPLVYVFVVPEIRMVLLGRTGTGKSSFGNTILGKKVFKSRKSAKSITTKCEISDRIWNERRLVVVDTPGFFDTELVPELIIPEISGSYQSAAPGPDVFLIVLTFDRFTPQEEAAAKWISEVFDERALDYCIIVFTGLDNLKRDEITPEEFLQDAPAFLQNLIQKCNGRYIAVDNTGSDGEKEEILKNLLDKISKMVKANGGQFYNNNKFIQISSVLEKYPGWFDPLKPDGTVNLLPETQNIVADELSARTVFNEQ